MKTHIGPQSIFFFFNFCLYYRSDPHFDPVPELASFDAGAEHNRFVLEIIYTYIVSYFDLARNLDPNVLGGGDTRVATELSF